MGKSSMAALRFGIHFADLAGCLKPGLQTGGGSHCPIGRASNPVVVDSAGMAPERICLEITEGVLMEPAHCARLLA